MDYLNDIPKVIKQLTETERRILINIYACMHEKNVPLFTVLFNNELDLINRVFYINGIFIHDAKTPSKYCTHNYTYASAYGNLSKFGLELAKVLYEIDRL